MIVITPLLLLFLYCVCGFGFGMRAHIALTFKEVVSRLDPIWTFGIIIILQTALRKHNLHEK